MNLSSLLAATLAVMSPLGAADWTQFRGPNGDGVSSETGVPTRLEATSITWSIALPGRGFSSPLIVGDKVFVTAGSGARQDRLHVLCFRVTDGALLWERQFLATGRTMTHEKIGAATPTPASDGKAVYAIFSSNDCVALDLDGRLLWFRGLGRDYPNASNSLGMSSSLVVVDGVVVAMVENDSESFTAGLDARTGVNRWKLDRPKKANWTSPVVFKAAGQPNRVLLQSSQGVAAVDPTTGKVVWDVTDGASTVPTLVERRAIGGSGQRHHGAGTRCRRGQAPVGVALGTIAAGNGEPGGRRGAAAHPERRRHSDLRQPRRRQAAVAVAAQGGFQCHPGFGGWASVLRERRRPGAGGRSVEGRGSGGE